MQSGECPDEIACGMQWYAVVCCGMEWYAVQVSQATWRAPTMQEKLNYILRFDLQDKN